MSDKPFKKREIFFMEVNGHISPKASRCSDCWCLKFEVVSFCSAPNFFTPIDGLQREQLLMSHVLGVEEFIHTWICNFRVGSAFC